MEEGKRTIGMEDGGLELHFWWQVWKFLWEREPRAEETSAIVFAVVVDHEHDLPHVEGVVD